MDYASSLYKFDDDTRKILFPESEKCFFVDVDKKKTAYMKELKKKRKEETKYQPLTKTSVQKQQENMCDKLFKNIME